VRPELFEVFGYGVPAYMVGQLLAILVVGGWLSRMQGRLKLPEDVGVDMTLLGFFSVFAGGRVEALRRSGSLFDVNLYELTLGGRGFAFFGVLLFCLLGSALYARWHGRHVLDFWDAMAPVVPLGLIVYRVGCLLAGCCYGTPTELPWGLSYPESWRHHEVGVRVHPVPIYELLGAAASFFMLRRLQGREHGRGDILLAFLLLLAPLRFIADVFRGDVVQRMAALGGLQLTYAQWWCLFFGSAALGAIVVRTVRRRRPTP